MYKLKTRYHFTMEEPGNQSKLTLEMFKLIWTLENNRTVNLEKQFKNYE